MAVIGSTVASQALQHVRAIRYASSTIRHLYIASAWPHTRGLCDVDLTSWVEGQ